jgi:hypothetical protein
MLTIDVVNTGKGTNENAQYRYRVHVNGEEIQRGEIGGHNRGHGWAVLLSSIANKHLVKVECGWTRTPSIIEDEDTWTTLCGNVWMFEEGTPQDNGMKFCCYCGRPIVQIEAE